MKKIAQVVIMSLMLTALFASMNTPAAASINGPVAGTPAPRPLCFPGDPNCNPGPMWPTMAPQGTPAPRPLCFPGDPNCNPGPMWPTVK